MGKGTAFESPSEQFERLIALNAGKEINELQDANVKSLEKFSAGTNQADDINLHVIRRGH